jgi:lysyl-tRNA synthetase class I
VHEICLHDTRSGELQPLVPRDAGNVGIYACGPTVYGRIHVGNARPFVVFSLLKRFLAHEGLSATLVITTRPTPRLSASADPTPSPAPPRRSKPSWR